MKTILTYIMIWTILYVILSDLIQNEYIEKKHFNTIVTNTLIYDAAFYIHLYFYGSSYESNWHNVPIIILIHWIVYKILRYLLMPVVQLKAFYAWFMPWTTFLMLEVIPWYTLTWYFQVGITQYMLLHIYYIAKSVGMPLIIPFYIILISNIGVYK